MNDDIERRLRQVIPRVASPKVVFMVPRRVPARIVTRSWFRRSASRRPRYRRRATSARSSYEQRGQRSDTHRYVNLPVKLSHSAPFWQQRVTGRA